MSPVEPAPPATDRSLKATLETISLVIGPTTLLTALALWFGWTLTNARAAYFGLDSSVLGFTTADYLYRSADAMFVPLAVLLTIVIGAMSVHQLASRLFIRRGVRGRIVTGWIVLGLGLILSVVGVRAVFVPVPVVRDYYLLPPLVLGTGVTLTVYAEWILRQLTGEAPPARAGVWGRLVRVSAVLLVLLCVFWASTLYATALGRGRGEAIGRNLWSRPRVTLFSKYSLDLATTTTTEPRTATYRFRYSGLRLIVHSSGRYFLVTDGWSHSNGAVIVLNDSPDIRIEFTPGEGS